MNACFLPAGVLSREAARYTEGFVFTVGVGDDLVMRLSVESAENLRTKIMQTIHATKLPKVHLIDKPVNRLNL